MDNFNALLEKPDLKLEEILGSTDLVAAIRTELSSLFDYLSQDSVITELAEWCMTSKFVDHPMYPSYSVIAVSVFLSTSMNIFDFVLESAAFAETLHHFLESEDSLNSKYCGHFYRILSTQIRWGTPALFTSYNDTKLLLFNRLQMSAIRDMIELIILTSADEALNTQQVLSDLAEISESNEELSYDAESCLIDIFTSITPDSDIFIHFCHPEYILHMINAAIKCPSLCMANDIIKMIISISKVSPESIILDAAQNEILTVNSHNITNLSVCAIPLMNIPICDLFSLFFSENAHMFLHGKLCALIDDMSVCSINGIASIPNFLQNIIEAYGTQKWCPHMFKIVLVFSSIDSPCRALRSRQWCNFLRNHFLNTVRIIENEYGGHISCVNAAVAAAMAASNSNSTSISSVNATAGYEDDSEGSDSDDETPQITNMTQYWAEEEEEEEEFENLTHQAPLETQEDANSSRIEENDNSGELEIYI